MKLSHNWSSAAKSDRAERHTHSYLRGCNATRVIKRAARREERRNGRAVVDHEVRALVPAVSSPPSVESWEQTVRSLTNMGFTRLSYGTAHKAVWLDRPMPGSRARCRVVLVHEDHVDGTNRTVLVRAYEARIDPADRAAGEVVRYLVGRRDGEAVRMSTGEALRLVRLWAGKPD